MANNSQSVGFNALPRSLQLKGEKKTEHFAPVGGGNVIVTAADLIAAAVADGTIMSGYKQVDNSLVSVAADGSESVIKIDIDLKPIGGGEGAIGDASRTTTSDAIVTDLSGSTQNMDGGGSRTFGSLEPDSSGFNVPANFLQVEIIEGSLVEITTVFARAPVDEATL